jgi:hypothetical protein
MRVSGTVERQPSQLSVVSELSYPMDIGADGSHKDIRVVNRLCDGEDFPGSKSNTI